MELEAVATELAGSTPPFLLLHRPTETGAAVEVLTGEITEVDSLADLPLATGAAPAPCELVVLVPYRQIAERRFACRDDGAPLLVMSVRTARQVDRATVVRDFAGRRIEVTEIGFDPDDDTYAETVREIVNEEIGRGEGANFVIRRCFNATLAPPVTDAALVLFSRLLAGETGAYWTFLLHTGSRILVGATPERHVSVRAGEVVMTPISGTQRVPSPQRTLPRVLDFLADRKETEELFMVVDEELKMMARICEPGIRVHGPYLREMARVLHTEYTLTGRTRRDLREILRETMFVPTVTGSPLENACRVIERYETEGRGYYSGILAVVGRDPDGTARLDSSVLIRTADIAVDGAVCIGVGATLVRHSDPGAETAETHAKTAALLGAMRDAPAAASPTRGLAGHREIRARLAQRNRTLARYWLGAATAGERLAHGLVGLRALVIDGEDAFTAMLRHQLCALGIEVTISRFDELRPYDEEHVVIVGPGPGDPRDDNDNKIRTLRSVVAEILARRQPLLAICLGHQILCGLLGLELIRKPTPHQGLQRTIDLFGQQVHVGFYNTFAARAPADRLTSHRLPGEVLSVSRDEATHEVYAMRGLRVCSLQFHPESLLTEDGLTVLGEQLSLLVRPTDGRRGLFRVSPTALSPSGLARWPVSQAEECP